MACKTPSSCTRQQWRSSCEGFVQIICVGGQHFVCASNITSPPGVVDVYDSLPSYSIKSSTLRKQLATIVKTDESAFQVRHVAVQHQSGGSDCGLFSIAFAQALCARVDPHLLAFDQCKMREHLHLCFEEEEISPFPPAKRSRRLTRKRITHSSLVPVYCTCRLPWNKQDDHKGPLTQCNRCKEWFHKQCAAFIVNPTTIKAKTRKVGTHFFILYLIPTTISLKFMLYGHIT